ncbi:MAG TPA: LTA synthase family protein [Chitinophagaceae bacterium]|nr:LTA synthase family protein [Chitinophagaceae bacterium]
MRNIIHSRLIRFLLLTGLFYLAVLSLLRLVFHLVFAPAGDNNTADAFWMGFRYDARVVCVLLLLIYFLSLFVLPFSSFSQSFFRRLILLLTRFFGLLVILVYTFDFAHFAYLRQRLNASVLSYAEDTGISATMVWQSYPVIKIMLGWLVAFLLLLFATRWLYKKVLVLPDNVSMRNHAVAYTLSFFLLALGIFGRAGQFPLRWSDAYELDSDYKANLALNPFQSFMSSLKFRHAGFDREQVKHYYNLMSSMLGVKNPDTASLNFTRNIIVADTAQITHTHNVVLVICESFSAYKSSMWGNPLNTTPYFNELCKQGTFFKNCFSPAYGTARGIWAIITGIPDVTDFKTASRNPNLVDQQTILNQLKEYEKFYFLGGSASWANIRGVLKDNISGLHLYEQEDYSSPKIDVWGISDKNLFLEANKVLRKQTTPFFAVIQTADNHRPYTIPKEDRPFIKMRTFPKDTLDKYGFWTNEELNAYAYMDYTYKVFMDAASKESYFKNTVFVFVGDHGIRGIAGDMMPKVWTEQSLTLQHVPMLFYAPGIIPPQVIERKVSQVDIMPTIAGLVNKPVVNTTMGRNIFSLPPVSDSDYINNHAFVLDFDRRLIGLVGGKYYYEYSLDTKQDGFYPLTNNIPLGPNEPAAGERSLIKDLTLGYYETSRFMLFNNKKRKP